MKFLDRLIPVPYISDGVERIRLESSSIKYEEQYKCLSIFICVLCSLFALISSSAAIYASYGKWFLALIIGLSLISFIPLLWVYISFIVFPGHTIGGSMISLLSVPPSALALGFAFSDMIPIAIIASLALIVSTAIISAVLISIREIAVSSDAIVISANNGLDSIGEKWAHRRVDRAVRHIANHGGKAPDISDMNSAVDTIFDLDEDGNISESDETYGIGGLYNAGTIVVLGYRIDDGNGVLARRRDVVLSRITRAVEYARYKSFTAYENHGIYADVNDAPINGVCFVLCGGQLVDDIRESDEAEVKGGTNESNHKISEAGFMSSVLPKDVDDDFVFLDEISSNTEDNIEFASAIIEENNLPYPAIIVTSRSHIPRVKRIVDRAGNRGDMMFTEQVKYVPARTPFMFAPHIWCEEVMASLKDYWMYGGINSVDNSRNGL